MAAAPMAVLAGPMAWFMASTRPAGSAHRAALLLRRGLLILLFGPGSAALLPARGTAQILGDWQIVYSDSAFDFLVTRRGFGPADPDRYGPRVLRVAASRMLVRYIEPMRLRITAARERVGAPVVGYGRFASSTYLLDVDCDERSVALIETTDFDDDGAVLSRTRPDRRLTRTVDGWTPTAIDRLIRWACNAEGNPNSTPATAGVHNERPGRESVGLEPAMELQPG